MAVILTSSQIQEVFEIQSSGTLSKWKEAGAKEAFVGRNQWDLKIFLKWWLENIYGEPQDTDNPLKQAKLEYWQAKAEGERIRIEQLKENLISREVIAKEWGWRMVEVANGLDALKDRLPPLLEGKDQTEMREVLDEEIQGLKENYWREGRFCPRDALPKRRSRGSQKRGNRTSRKKS